MEPKNMYDAVIIGGGPAGLTAAIYLARAKYRVLVVEKETFGGQITITSEVVNYPGVFSASGSELTENMRKQAEAFGAEFLSAEAEKIEAEEDIKKVITNRGTFGCFGILAATGAHPRTVGFEGEAKFKGRGVAYCATCDGEFFTGKEIFVIGGGFAAAEESVFLTKYGKHITILIREEDFTCAKAVADRARENEKITVLTETEVKYVRGEDSLREICYVNLKTGEETVYKNEEEGFGVFVFAGYVPETKLLEEIAELDPQGYVVADEKRSVGVPGVYAAGDICVKNLRQVVTAVGDGAAAATELERYAAAMQKKTGIVPERPEKKDISEKEGTEEKGSGFFAPELISQLNSVFSKMENNLILKLYLDERPVSAELEQYMKELVKMTDKLKTEIAHDKEEFLPCVRVFRQDGSYTGLGFHGVPGGHEFTSFILGLYNAAGPGQATDSETEEEIEKISSHADMKVFVSLSCTMCPELVTAAQKTAALSPYVTAEVFDAFHFPDLRKKYNIMSVPCLVINDRKVTFGKKNIKQILEILRESA